MLLTASFCISLRGIETIRSSCVLLILQISNWTRDGEDGSSLQLHRRWCRCTSSCRGRCSPGTSGTFYTAASSSEPSSQRCRRYQSLSPETGKMLHKSHTCTHRYTQKQKVRVKSESVKLVMKKLTVSGDSELTPFPVLIKHFLQPNYLLHPLCYFSFS